MRVNLTGTSHNLQLMTLNNAQWTRNYYQGSGPNRITYISMDVPTSGTNVVFLRVLFKKIVKSSTIEIWCTTNAIALIFGEAWKKVNFQINEASVIGVSGINPTQQLLAVFKKHEFYTTMRQLANQTQLKQHQISTTSWQEIHLF